MNGRVRHYVLRLLDYSQRLLHYHQVEECIVLPRVMTAKEQSSKTCQKKAYTVNVEVSMSLMS